MLRCFDQHCHCRVSPDSEAPMRLMAESARDHGMELVCFTDHVDMDDDRTGAPMIEWQGRWETALAEWNAVTADPPKGIELRLGMELGEANHQPEAARAAAARPELDFVLGSLHNLRNTMDFYHIPYASEAECDRWNRKYLAELRELAAVDFYDVMAHIGYTSRYMHRRGFSSAITPEEYREELEDIFRTLIQGGRGIEVNVSGLREGHTTYPTAPVLSLYRELGGEIITVGSDAHDGAAAGVAVREGFELLESLGFRYVARFTKRKPEFIRIGG